MSYGSFAYGVRAYGQGPAAAAAVGAFLARFGPIILQAVNRASTY